MGKLVTESGNNGVVVRMSEGAENIGDDKAGELSIVVVCPLFEEFPSFLFGFTVEVVAFFLGGGGKKYMWC